MRITSNYLPEEFPWDKNFSCAMYLHFSIEIWLTDVSSNHTATARGAVGVAVGHGWLLPWLQAALDQAGT